MVSVIKTVIQKISDDGVAAPFFGLFMGRCTFAAIMFSIFVVYGWLHGRDLTSYALFVTAVQGLLVLHSYKEDVAEMNEVRKEKEQ